LTLDEAEWYHTQTSLASLTAEKDGWA